MTRTLISMLLLVLATSVTAKPKTAEKISSFSAGVYHPDDRDLIPSAFTHSVTHYMRRYKPTVVEERADYVKMRVVYRYPYDIELRVRDKEYEVSVTLAGKSRTLAKARADVIRLAANIHEQTDQFLIRQARVRGAPGR